MNFTKEQQRVIDIRDTNVLVSAAAGSGKTAVIVRRVIERVIKDRIDISSLLIVTFTRAAAEEMKGRIRDAFEERLEASGDDPVLSAHLKRQLSLIYDAPIMTIDSFCLDVIRNNFNVLNIDPAFRVADEGELKMLKDDVMEELLERHYKEGEDSDFYGFLERFSVKKDDQDVTDAIDCLERFAQSRPDPEGFLRKAYECYEIKDEDELNENPVVKEAIDRTGRTLLTCKRALERAMDIAGMPSGPSAYLETLTGDLELVDMLLSKKNYKDLLSAFLNLSFSKLSQGKSEGEDPALRKKAKDLRDSFKKNMENLKKRYFSADTGSLLEEFAELSKDAAVLSNLTKEYMRDLSEAKRKRNIVDFSDIEHMALRMLKEEAVRDRYKKSFAEIIVDEYQDSNRLQEEIFTGISNGKNYFCVGDVKQSIYSFRDACPALFMEKFSGYKREGGTLLLLAKNFRSRNSVIDAVNGLFKNIMHASSGSVEYDRDQFLNFGGLYKSDTGDDSAEYILAWDRSGENSDKDELEAALVAKRIEELVGRADIEDKKTGQVRKCGYGDIVILMRALKGRDEKFMNVLIKKGIPVSLDSSTGYLMTDEIRDIINLLFCIDNPIRDIPLAGVCLSVFGGFDESKLALIRALLPERDLFFALEEAAKDGTDIDEDVRKKAKVFLEKLKRYRRLSSFLPIHELLSVIINDHGYDNYVRALSEGQMRLDNLNMLLLRASEFEKTSFKGLFRFIRYIEYIKKYEISLNSKGPGSAGADAVRIMSIHHSKGLEFPVVFLCGCHRSFNRRDLKQRLLIDDELGAGMDLIDINKRLKRRTFAKSVISDRKNEAIFGEELRVLYVAMTRAEQKIIMTGLAKKAPEEGETASCSTKLPASFEEADSFGELVEYALDIDEGLGACIKRYEVGETDLVLDDLEEKRDLQFERSDLIKRAENADPCEVEELRGFLSRRYPFEAQKPAPGKLSVSELKHEAMEERGVELLSAIEEKTDFEPRFITGLKEKPGGPVRGALRGTAYHTAFEHLDPGRVKDPESAGEYLDLLKAEGRLTEDEAGMIDPGDILKFAKSSLGDRMSRALREGKLYREQPFVILLKASEISDLYSDEEDVMVQGVIDACFEEEGGLVIVDYKTDRVKTGKELVDRYKTQLYYYAKAMTQLTGRKVLEKILYSVTLGECVIVE